jgi:hypothetical protein
MFLLGEMPFITGLYERARQELDDDENLSIDGIKEMLLAARDRYQSERKSRARKITPKLLSVYFSYIRNLALIERRMTPDLYTMVIAAQQIVGDQFAIYLTEVAHRYPYTDLMPFPVFKMGLGDLADVRTQAPASQAPAGAVGAKLEPLRSVQLAAGRPIHREVPHARQGRGDGAFGQ